MSDYLRMDELTATCGITPRNIRRYITLGLVAPPDGRTRNATYNTTHVADLLTVRALLQKGLSLQQVKEQMTLGNGLSAEVQRAKAGAFLRWIPVARGVTLVFEVGGKELPKSIQDALTAELARECAQRGLTV